MKKTVCDVEEAELPLEDKFILRYRKYEDYYLLLLFVIGVSVAAAIGIGLFENVWLGAALAIVSAMVYKICAEDEARRQLGIRVSHECGRVTVKKGIASWGDTLIVPRKMEFAVVTKIADRAFDSKKNAGLKAVYLPVGVKYIGESVFGESDSLPEIHFEGTEEQWSCIESHTDLSGAVVFFEVTYPVIPKRQLKKKNKEQ